MAILVQFTNVQNRQVWINPDQVRSVTEHTNDLCIVDLGSNEGTITIKQPVAYVAGAIFNAGKQPR
jgi:hypothetical protein